MMRQFTIELRVDLPKRKMARLLKVTRQAARHLYATSMVLSTKSMPHIALFSDDFFTGHEELALKRLPKKAAKGK